MTKDLLQRAAAIIAGATDEALAAAFPRCEAEARLLNIEVKRGAALRRRLTRPEPEFPKLEAVLRLALACELDPLRGARLVRKALETEADDALRSALLVVGARRFFTADDFEALVLRATCLDGEYARDHGACLELGRLAGACEELDTATLLSRMHELVEARAERPDEPPRERVPLQVVWLALLTRRRSVAQAMKRYEVLLAASQPAWVGLQRQDVAELRRFADDLNRSARRRGSTSRR